MLAQFNPDLWLTSNEQICSRVQLQRKTGVTKNLGISCRDGWKDTFYRVRIWKAEFLASNWSQEKDNALFTRNFMISCCPIVRIREFPTVNICSARAFLNDALTWLSSLVSRLLQMDQRFALFIPGCAAARLVSQMITSPTYLTTFHGMSRGGTII